MANSADVKNQNSLVNGSGFKPSAPVGIGGVVLSSDPIDYNVGRSTIKVMVKNTGDRPVQVGSHFHFFEVNRYLEFDRYLAFGYHLNIPATTAIRFEPGDQREVELVAYSGKRRVIGFNNLVMGYTGDEDSPTYYPVKMRSFHVMVNSGFKTLTDSASAAGATNTNTKK